MPANLEPMDRRNDSGGQRDTLALVYQGLFTVIVRLQAGRQKLPDSATFRRRIQDALQDAQRDAESRGYSSRSIRDAESAVVAFLDEAVLSSQGPARETWGEQTLSVQLFGESNAGEVFYERLDELKGEGDSTQLGDTLEVFLLCLLLGFEGRYSGNNRIQAAMVAERLRSRLEGIRGKTYPLSPPLRPMIAPAVAVRIERKKNRWPLWLAGSPAVALLLFLLYKVNLSLSVSEVSAILAGVR